MRKQARIALPLLALGLAFHSVAYQSASSAPATTQTTHPPQPPSGVGLETPWDVREIVANVLKDDQQFRPLFKQIDPQQWYQQKGAPTTYILQLQAAQQQLNDVLTTAKLVDQKTDDLPLALDLYFRLEALDVTARSIEEGAQRYAPRDVSDKLSALIAYNFNSRERLRDYLRDLAASTQQNFKMADEEAQRCRAIISKQPPPASKSKKH